MGNEAQENVFVMTRPDRDADGFRQFAEIAARLKPYGRVLVEVAHLADKTWYDIPEGGSPWHEYTANKAPLHKFFPPSKLAPHLPVEWIEANRNLILEKSKILREMDLKAHYRGQDPFFLPDSFFDENPHLRGPRVDHPGRTIEPAYAPCVDQPEVLEMVEWMFCELKKNVPEVEMYTFTQNDAGSGLCWSDYLYPGAHGPTHCQIKNHGKRMRDFLVAMHDGAQKGGGDVELHMHGNLSRFEYDMLEPILPANTHFSAKSGRGCKTRSRIGVGGISYYPVLGLINPLGILKSMAATQRPGSHLVQSGFSGCYGRAAERLDTIGRQVDLMVEYLKEPVSGRIAILQKLREICGRWGGEALGDDLFETFCSLDDTLRQRGFMGSVPSGEYLGVSTRHITRPMVVRPRDLTPDEEAYFLPHVFNIDIESARKDYMNIHGSNSRLLWNDSDWYWIGPLQSHLSSLLSVANALERMDKAPEAEWLAQMATSLRITACIMRSSNNQFFGHVFRERNKAVLDGEPGKLRELSQWRETYRSETENTLELIRILENGGLACLAHAENARYEDTFLLGPDIIDQLKKKLKIMGKYNTDFDRHLIA